MAILKILTYPDPKLREVAAPVTSFDEDLKQKAHDMLETLYTEEHGVGLAATQVGIPLRILVMDFSEKRNEPMFIINPEISEEEDMYTTNECCISFPTIMVKTKRAKKIIARYQDLEGNVIEHPAEDLMAQCFQHEIEHLDGKLLIDHVSPLKQSLIKKKLDKYFRIQKKLETQ